MYDNVTFWLRRYEIGDEAFEGLRYFCKEGRNVGYMGNIRIEYVRDRKDATLLPQQIKVSGSIRKWFTSSNVEAPTFQEAVKEINEICATMRIEPRNARVTGLEFGGSYKVRKPPRCYLELMSSYRDSKRSNIAKAKDVETVYFCSSAKRSTYKHMFYDKGAEELEKNGVDLNSYVLRYEIKILRKLRTFADWNKPITLATLQDPQFFTNITNYYLTVYDTINKFETVESPCKFKTPREGEKIFYSRVAVEYLKSHPDALKNFLLEAKHENPEITAITISRMHSNIKKTLAIAGSRGDAEAGLIPELTSLIYAECKRCAPTANG